MSWFVREGTRPVGPLTEGDVLQRLVGGEISPEDLLWNEVAREWRPALSWPSFRAATVPAFQEVRTVPDDAPEWVILTLATGRTTGPWSLNQVREGLREGRWTGRDYLWKKGMTGWARLESRPEGLVPSEAF